MGAGRHDNRFHRSAPLQIGGFVMYGGQPVKKKLTGLTLRLPLPAKLQVMAVGFHQDMVIGFEIPGK